MTDRKTLDKAREYAQWMIDNTPRHHQSKALAAAEVIQSLPDEWVDAKELRKLLDKWEGCEITSDAHLLYRELEALLPAPEPASPRPEDVPVGEPWQVEVGGKDCIGYRNDTDGKIPWLVVHRNSQDFDYLFDSSVTLVARLVPEQGEA